MHCHANAANAANCTQQNKVTMGFWNVLVINKRLMLGVLQISLNVELFL